MVSVLQFSCFWLWELMMSCGFIPRVKLSAASSQPADVSSLICLLFIKWGDAAVVNASVTVQLNFYLSSHLSHQLTDPETAVITSLPSQNKKLCLKSAIINRRCHTSSIIQTEMRVWQHQRGKSQEVRSIWAEWQQRAAESLTQWGWQETGRKWRLLVKEMDLKWAEANAADEETCAGSQSLLERKTCKWLCHGVEPGGFQLSWCERWVHLDSRQSITYIHSSNSRSEAPANPAGLGLWEESGEQPWWIQTSTAMLPLLSNFECVLFTFFLY